MYPDAEFEHTLELIDKHDGGFALTGATFPNDPVAIRKAGNKLRYAAGDFYTKSSNTGAVIGQQTSGGSRTSGTCDKAGSVNLMMRSTAPRTLKEEYNKLNNVPHPSNA